MAQPVHGVEHLADVVIHLGQHVGPVAIAGLAGKGRVRQRRQMRLCEGRIGEEGFSRLRLAFHERDRPPRDFGVDQPALFEVVHFYLAAVLTLAALHELFRWHDPRRIAGRARPQRFIRRARDAVPLIKALIVRQTAIVAAEVPFAVERCRIARGR